MSEDAGQFLAGITFCVEDGFRHTFAGRREVAYADHAGTIRHGG